MSDALTATEVWMVEHGLPSFTRRPVSVSVRAVTLLLVFVAGVEMLAVAPSPDWPGWADLLAGVAAVGAVTVLVAWAFDVERRRDPRSWWRLTGDVMFAAGPGLAAWVLDSSAAALVLVVVNVLVLAAVAVDQRLGLVAVVRWCVRHGTGQLRLAAGRLSRSVPLLAVVMVALFFTSEVWQAAAGLDPANLLAVVGLFGTSGVLFAVNQARAGIVEQAESPDPGVLLSDNPAWALPAGRQAPPLSPLERFNVGVLLVVSQLVLVAVTACAFALVVVVLGALAVPVEVLHGWLGGPPSQLAGFDGFIEVHLTWELLALGALMAGVAGLVFAVTLTGDREFQEASRDRLADELAAAFAARARYLACFEPRPGELPVPPDPVDASPP